MCSICSPLIRHGILIVKIPTNVHQLLHRLHIYKITIKTRSQVWTSYVNLMRTIWSISFCFVLYSSVWYCWGIRLWRHPGKLSFVLYVFLSSFIHSLVCSIIYLRICSCVQYSFIPVFLYSFIPLFICSFVHLFICSFAHLFICSSVHLCIYAFVHLCIYSFIRCYIISLIYSFIYSFFSSFILSFICSFINLEFQWPYSMFTVDN